MPSPKNASTISALHYLRRQAKSSQLFTADQLAVASGWSLSSVKTYLSKKLGQLVEKTERGYRVKPEVLRLSDAQFLSHMTQVKPVFTDYRRTKHDHLLTYEFLLPLTREDKLRQSLDELFFTDTIRRRITEIGPESLRALVHTSRPLGKKALLAALIDRVSSIAGGYSISHTSGRFRAAALVSREEAGRLFAREGRYLIDETTAVVRFLVPLKQGEVELPDDVSAARQVLDSPVPVDQERLWEEVRATRFLFFQLFVEAVVRTVDGEDEIWLIEESPEGRRLYKWSRRS